MNINVKNINVKNPFHACGACISKGAKKGAFWQRVVDHLARG